MTDERKEVLSLFVLRRFQRRKGDEVKDELERMVMLQSTGNRFRGFGCAHEVCVCCVLRATSRMYSTILLYAGYLGGNKMENNNSQKALLINN